VELVFYLVSVTAHGFPLEELEYPDPKLPEQA
jgi:hypothetical protein